LKKDKIQHWKQKNKGNIKLRIINHENFHEIK